MAAVVFAQPARSKWNERQPEQQMQVSPHNGSADMAGQLKQMVVIVPVRANGLKTDDIGKQQWQQGFHRI